MANFRPVPLLPATAPVPGPRPVSPAVVPPTPATPSSTGEALTLDALMARQKQAAAMQGEAMQQPVQNIPQGLAQMAWSVVSALQERRAGNELAQGQQEVAQAMSGLNYDTGELSPEAMQTLWQRDPASAMEMAKTAMTLRASKAKQDVYGPVITGEQAKALNLDPTKSYQLNKSTGQYDAIGGGGITIGTGEKLSEALVKDTTYYPGALSANLELEGVDQELTSSLGAAKKWLPGENYLQDPAYQKARTAGDAWIINVLRRESGATISPSEFDDNRRTYLPQPGDGPEQIEYKRRLREEKTETLRYGLEAAAPDTLAKIDAAQARKRKAWEERRKAAATPAPDPNNPNPPADPNTPPADPNQPPVEPYPQKPANYAGNWPTQGAWPLLSPAARAFYLKQLGVGQ